MSTEQTNTAAPVAGERAHVASEKANSKKAATPKKVSHKGEKTPKDRKAKGVVSKGEPKAGKKVVKPEREASAPRAESKGAKILEMIGRAKGANLAEIMAATAWQAHSVRGYISSAAKKQGIKIESVKNQAGERVYKLVK